MNNELIEDKDFVNEDYSEKGLSKSDYENCTFQSCNFNNTDLSEIKFSECKFDNCDLSMAKINQTGFRDVVFKDCKLLGLQFDECNGILFSFEMESCVLNFSSFIKMKIKNTQFKDCELQEVDFTSTDLTESSFKNCNLDRATFENTILEKVDFRTAQNFSINPERNSIFKAKFSKENVIALLKKYQLIIE